MAAGAAAASLSPLSLQLELSGTLAQTAQLVRSDLSSTLGFPSWHSGYESADAGDTGSTPGLGRFHMPCSERLSP